MGKRSQRKGYRTERKMVKMLSECGVQAYRVPLSGATQAMKGDIIIDGQYQVEVKARACSQGWRRIEGWLSGNDFLFLVADGKDPLCVMPWARMIELLKRGREK